MAGGAGERFWPLSRTSMPKQFLHMEAVGTTLLERTVSTVSAIVPPESVYIATGSATLDSVRKTQTKVPPENIFAEPEKRNTAGCLIWSAAQLLARFGGDGSDIVMAIFPADHVITQTELFAEMVESALDAAGNEDALVTFGIRPTRPEMGYGYLEFDDAALDGSEKRYGYPVYPVRRFYEKPDLETAKDYVSLGTFNWNSGMFFWRLSVFLNELERATPEMARTVRDIAECLRDNDPAGAAVAFGALESTSIDYALMEKSEHVLALRAGFGWDDVGSWDSLYRVFPRDADGNIAVGDPVIIDTNDTIVYNASGKDSMAVGVLGVEGLAVIVTDDGVLVTSKERAQDVKDIVRRLKERGSPQV